MFGLAIGQAQVLTLINPNFANVQIRCAPGYAYQSIAGGDCVNRTIPYQRFNSASEIGWIFTPESGSGRGSGLTNPNTIFNPPSFSGLSFGAAAFLQGSSLVSQSITGFVGGRIYTLSFYLGSRYQNAGGVDGNQTVQAEIDGEVIGTWALTSYTPFTIETAVFTVTSDGLHVLDIGGTLKGDHTAFFSGVNIAMNVDQ